MRTDDIKNEDTGELIKQDDFVMSFAKGLSLLEAFSGERQKLNVTQVAEKTELSRTAARRYLKTLKFLGYLDSDEHYFWLTHKVLRFSSAYLNTSHLSKIAQPILNRLSAQTGLTYSVAVLDANEVVPIARSYAPQQEDLRITPFGMHLGNRLPAHATSTGKILLACAAEHEQILWLQRHGLKRLTALTLQDPLLFLSNLKQIAQQDYCLSREEHELGVIAIAVPLVDIKGHTVAALNCISQTHKVTEAHLLNTVLPLLMNTALEIRAIL
ncbi:IclR family transcriptional regulator [Acinetobacter calcoaceticus]|uniref:IclR family transcriptional regulator n=1 Tax=Acinetobacter calcoaceticus TaxID=471 RepID=A0A4R1Y071_ACICA|nr:IclR family transcriptional regulator [Acinetobacter calcoaceticus]